MVAFNSDRPIKEQLLPNIANFLVPQGQNERVPEWLKSVLMSPNLFNSFNLNTDY